LKNTAVRKMALNDSALFSFIGNRRTGKSTTSIILLFAIDPDASLEQICFRYDDLKYFLQLIRINPWYGKKQEPQLLIEMH
jgi:hypothetical protein